MPSRGGAFADSDRNNAGRYAPLQESDCDPRATNRLVALGGGVGQPFQTDMIGRCRWFSEAVRLEGLTYSTITTILPICWFDSR